VSFIPFLIIISKPASGIEGPAKKLPLQLWMEPVVLWNVGRLGLRDLII